MNVLKVLPTSRSIRSYYSNVSSSNLAKLISIGDFESKAIYVKDKKIIDNDLRVFLFQQACDFSEFKKLHIDIDYYSFLIHHKIILKFLNEISYEGVSIDDIDISDTYAEYTEHLEILKEVLKRYRDILDQDDLTDRMFIPKEYALNTNFINSFDEIEVYLEGYLSHFEWNLLIKISEIKPLGIKYKTNKFNTKMTSKVSEFLGVKLETNKIYDINLSKKSIVSITKTKNLDPIYDEFASSSRLEQVGFVKKKIYDYLKQGIKAEDIVVLTPDESFARFLKSFDKENNLNFAMGESFVYTKSYKIFEAIYEYLQESSHQNTLILNRYGIDIDDIKDRSTSNFLDFINSVIPDDISEDEKVLLNDELYYFEKLLLKLGNLDFTKILHIFLTRLNELSINDNRGGKITVMGVLESRGMDFDGVIVVDFNEDIVPKKSKKDFFLSTNVRKNSNLPTINDRENLQKSYFLRLFSSAKALSISYVEDTGSSKSLFLKELGLKKLENKNYSYEKILLNDGKSYEHFLPKDLELDYDFSSIKISATKLKTYLDCKRKYYFKYIKEIKEPVVLKKSSDEKDIGIYLHDALKNIYTKSPTYDSEELLLNDIKKELSKVSDLNDIQKLKLDVWMKHLNEFVTEEIKRFDSGYRVYATEIPQSINHNGLNLIGIIDRIDIKDDELYVLDYKSGKVKVNKKITPNITDFQLEFYYLLASSMGKVQNASFIELKSGKYKDEVLLNEKLNLLDQKLEELKEKIHNFTMTEDINKCRYCDFATMCDRN